MCCLFCELLLLPNAVDVNAATALYIGNKSEKSAWSSVCLPHGGAVELHTPGAVSESFKATDLAQLCCFPGIAFLPTHVHAASHTNNLWWIIQEDRTCNCSFFSLGKFPVFLHQSCLRPWASLLWRKLHPGTCYLCLCFIQVHELLCCDKQSRAEVCVQYIQCTQAWGCWGRGRGIMCGLCQELASRSCCLALDQCVHGDSSSHRHAALGALFAVCPQGAGGGGQGAALLYFRDQRELLCQRDQALVSFSTSCFVLSLVSEMKTLLLDKWTGGWKWRQGDKSTKVPWCIWNEDCADNGKKNKITSPLPFLFA